MKLARSTVSVCFNYSTSFSNDDFSSFMNSTKEARLLRNDILNIRLRCRPNLQTFTSCIRNKFKICEIQARSPSHHFTGKSAQTFLLESQYSKKVDGSMA